MANLSGADLSGTSLFGADLRGADLSAARLIKANLREADLRGTGGLVEDQLKRATSWELAYRDPEHAYGKPIPTPPDDE